MGHPPSQGPPAVSGKPTLAELCASLGATTKGLAAEEARRRLERSGPNALEEVRRSAWRQFGRFFWGPMPWMIEAAAVMSILVNDWIDLTIILILLLFKVTIGIRTHSEDEQMGLDVSEHGMWGYPEFYIPVPGGYGTESHSHLGQSAAGRPPVPAAVHQAAALPDPEP